MLRRLLLGLVEGSVIGVALAVAAARGLGLIAPGALVEALLGAGTGCLLGLVAGRPIWSRDAKTEALLKAFVGLVVGFGGAFALRRWLALPVDLSAFSLGSGAAGQLPTVTLPVIGTLLALFFELDHDGAGAAEKPKLNPRSKQRLETGASADLSDELDELDDEVERKHEKR